MFQQFLILGKFDLIYMEFLFFVRKANQSITSFSKKFLKRCFDLCESGSIIALMKFAK